MTKPSALHKICSVLVIASALPWSGAAGAAAMDDAKGLWLTAEKDAVVAFNACPDQPGALCGRIVWDKDAGTSADTCGVHVAQLKRYGDDAWRDGWAYDPREKKKYKATVRVSGDTLTLRAFIGVEILGETQLFTRVASMPGSPSCKS